MPRSRWPLQLALWWKQFHEWSLWLYNIDDPPLAPTEHVVMETMAAQIKGPCTSPLGRLLLTNQRLFYLPGQHRFVRLWPVLPRLAIPLSEVVATGRRRWVRGLWDSFPGAPLWTLTLRDGTTYTFQNPRPEQWRQEVERLRGEDQA